MVADTLSRRLHICALAKIIGDWRNKITKEYVRDTWASGVIAGTIHDDRYMVMYGLIKFQGRIYLIPSSQFREVILKAFHDAPTARHLGVFKTYRQIRERFTWKGLKDDVQKHVKECTVCQQNKGEHTYPAGLLQPLPISNRKWESISMDFITGLPRVQGRDCIYEVVDWLTKFAHFFAIPSTYIIAQVADLFFREIFRLHGLPSFIISD